MGDKVEAAFKRFTVQFAIKFANHTQLRFLDYLKQFLFFSFFGAS